MVDAFIPPAKPEWPLLCVRVHRMHGKRVSMSPVPLRGTEMSIGSDTAGLLLSGALSVAPRHASLYREAGEWLLEPACINRILAVNGRKLLWGERHALCQGDCIELGFVSLLVESSPEYGTQAEALPDLPERIAPADAEPCSESIETQALSEAEELHALLSADAQNSAGSHALRYTSSDPLELILHPTDKEPEQKPEDRVQPRDILAELAAESNQALLHGELTLSTQPYATRFPAPQDLGPQESTTKSFATLEDILHGPLSIDDVLESFQKLHPGQRESDPLVAMLDQVHRPPDPLRLLAGLEEPQPREPELAPVLHRAHRSTGMDTPYLSFGQRSMQDSSSLTSPQSSEQASKQE